MELIRDDGRFVAVCPYEEKDIAKGAGFWWDGNKKQWYTHDTSNALNLLQYATGSVRRDLEAVRARKAAAVEESRAVDADINIPVPEGLEYRSFQKAGVAYALKRIGTLIGDDMGLGKTVQVCGIINADPRIKRVLVVPPASLRDNWKRELTKWLVRPMSIAVVDPKEYWPEEADIVIINYDIVNRYHDTLREYAWDLLVCDEAHMMKSKKSRRTQQIIGKKEKGNWRKWEIEPIPARRRVYLTGTPICNNPYELWPLINSLDPNEWRSFSDFAKQYCDAHFNGFGRDNTGASNLEELQRRLRETVMIRRLKSEVLTELPPKMRQVIEISAPEVRSIVKKEVKAYDDHQDRMARLREAVELAKASDDNSDYAEAVAHLREGANISFTEMAIVRQETAKAKIPYILQHLENCGDRKVVVFAHHKVVLKSLKEALGDKAVILTGDTAKGKRQEAVDRFQNDPNVQYFLGSIMAAGTGHTLTASSLVVFGELDWVPGNVSQAEDRCHRIGQNDSVTVQHLVFSGSIDARIAEVLVEKQAIIDKALNDPLGDLPIMSEEPATARVTRKQIEEEAPTLTPRQVTAVHEGLRQVASYCDGATKLDGMGFSRIDAGIGKSLAARGSLTPKQAVLGLRLVIKYGRQIMADVLAAAKGA